MKMQKDGVTEDELKELAAKIGFTIKNDDDLWKLYHAARKVGFWPELDRPKLDQKRFWIPPLESDIRYRPSPWYFKNAESTEKKPKKASKAAKQRTEALNELEQIKKLIAALEADPRAADLVEKPLKGVEELDSWLDEIH